MIVIIDTNIVVADFMLAGNQFQMFFAGLPRIGGRLRLPQVVLDEVYTKYTEDLEVQIRSAARVRHSLRSLGVNAPEVSIDLEHQCHAYRAHIESTLKVHSATILAYPQISHAEVVARDLKRAKPFGKASGYRDFLIWKSVVNQLYMGDPVTFVSANTRDFSEQGTIHPELEADLNTKFLRPRTVELISSLSAFNEKYTIPVLQTAETLKSELEKHGLPGLDLQGWVATHLSEILPSEDLLIHGAGLESRGMGSAGLPRLIGPPSISVGQVYQTEKNEYIADVSINLPVKFNLDFDYDDYRRSAQVRDILGSVDEPFTSASLDWESHFSIHGTLRVSGDPPVIRYIEVEDVGGY